MNKENKTLGYPRTEAAVSGEFEVMQLFDDGKADAGAATKLFPNQGLHAAARAFAASHKYAIQYLAQAPVLALAATYGGPGVRRMNSLYIAHKAGPLCDRGAPLREMMAAFGLAFPLRKLAAFALYPSALSAVQAVSLIDPVVLGRIIPEKPTAQRNWLGAVLAWRSAMARRAKSPETHFAWAAERMAGAQIGVSRATDMADFAASGEHFNPAWQWPRATEEMELWHDRLSIDNGVKRLKIKDTTRIDHGKHPNELSVKGFRFLALRSPGEVAAEGSAMRHCVASYIPTIMDGSCNIISIRQGQARVATLELSKGRVVQLKGKMNAAPDAAIKEAASAYAAEVRSILADKSRGRAA